jgi:hypothetical protein
MNAALGAPDAPHRAALHRPAPNPLHLADAGEGDDVVEARKRAMIASGAARPTDRFITARWSGRDEGRG